MRDVQMAVQEHFYTPEDCPQCRSANGAVGWGSSGSGKVSLKRKEARHGAKRAKRHGLTYIFAARKDGTGNKPPPRLWLVLALPATSEQRLDSSHCLVVC